MVEEWKSCRPENRLPAPSACVASVVQLYENQREIPVILCLCTVYVMRTATHISLSFFPPKPEARGLPADGCTNSRVQFEFRRIKNRRNISGTDRNSLLFQRDRKVFSPSLSDSLCVSDKQPVFPSASSSSRSSVPAVRPRCGHSSVTCYFFDSDAV